jgi:hypothetical protein
MTILLAFEMGHVKKRNERNRVEEVPLRSSHLRFYGLRQRGMNPGFRCDEMQNKSYPKGGAEKLRWRQAGKSAGRKENTYNWTNGGNSQTNCKRSNHPLAM